MLHPVAEDTAALVAPGERSRLRRVLDGGWLRALGLYLASRIVVYVAVSLSVLLREQFLARALRGPWPPEPAGARFMQALGSWDGSWYLLVARKGYFHPCYAVAGVPHGYCSQIAFLPGMPLLVRGTGAVTGLPVLDAAPLLTFVLGGLAAVVLWYLVAALCDGRVADRATALWVFFPASFVLSMDYGEAAALALAAGCLLALHRRRWLIAGLAAALATSVLPDVAPLIPACAWAALVAIKRDRAWAALLAPLLSLAGIAAYFAYLSRRTGDWLRWYHVEQRVWKSGNGWGHNTVHVVGTAFAHPTRPEDTVLTAFALFAVVGLALMIRWRPPVTIWIFTIGLLLASLDSLPVGTRGRVMLAAFPLTIAVARAARRGAFLAVLGAFAALLALDTLFTLTSVILAP